MWFFLDPESYFPNPGIFCFFLQEPIPNEKLKKAKGIRDKEFFEGWFVVVENRL